MHLHALLLCRTRARPSCSWVTRHTENGRPQVQLTVLTYLCAKGGSLGAGENQKQVSSVSHPPLEISPTPRDSHFPTAPATVRGGKRKTKTARAA
jgi:hypothetical protein